MSKTMNAVKLYQAVESALVALNYKNKDEKECDVSELTENIIRFWDEMPTAKTPKGMADDIYKAVFEVLSIKAEFNPRDETLPRGKEIDWVARMTIKNYWG